MHLRELIKSDIYRHYGCYKLPFLWKKHNVALACTIAYRKAHEYSSSRIPLIGLWMRYKLNKISRKYFFQVPYNVEIGPGFNFVHFGRLIIAPYVKIGSNCNIFTGVTIGATTRGVHVGVPTIGNNVWIGPNAVIVGGVCIGDDVLIAGNSYVNFDVPSHSVVIGNPARIHSKADATKDYICQQYIE